MQAIADIGIVQPASTTCSCPVQGDAQARMPAARPGRALTLAGAGPATPTDRTGSRPAATFLAQLIATAQKAPQTRQRRRAEPVEVTTTYAAAATPAAWIGGTLYRSL